MTPTDGNGAGNTRAWIMLMLAGVFEIGYALSVGGSKAFTLLNWSISAAVFFLLTLFALSSMVSRGWGLQRILRCYILQTS